MSESAKPGGAGRLRLSGDTLAGAFDVLLDAVVVALASGSIAYHVGLATSADRLTLAVTWVFIGLVSVIGIGLISRRAQRLEFVDIASSAVVRACLVAAAGATALYLRPPQTWWWVFLMCVLAAALPAGAVLKRAVVLRPAPEPRLQLWAAIVVGVVALGFAAASAVTSRPDLDDVYVVNRSVWVEQHSGPIPTADTIYTDEQAPGARSASRSPAFEVLTGLIAAAVPVSAATVLYLGVAPLASALSIFATWRLARCLGCRRAVLVTIGAATFLLLDGSLHAGFGNFQFGRLWQGKVVLVAVIVPAIWTYALRWARDGSPRDLSLLFAANVAAAGASSTGFFVAPIATAIVALGATLVSRRPARVVLAACATAYPVGFAVLSRSTGGELDVSPSVSYAVAPWARWALVFGAPAVGLTAAALTLGWLAVRDRTSRVVLAVASLALVGILYGPHAIDPLRLLAPGAAAILWRAVWVVPIPLLVGLALSLPWSLDARRASVAVAAVTVPCAVFFAATTSPVMAASNGVSMGRPRWDTGGDVITARRLIEEAGPGSVVAGPFEVDRVVPLISSTVRAVDPRPGWYPSGVDEGPRRAVQSALTLGLIGINERTFLDALDALEVDVVAVPATLADDHVIDALRTAGFVSRPAQRQYLIFKRET